MTALTLTVVGVGFALASLGGSTPPLQELLLFAAAVFGSLAIVIAPLVGILLRPVGDIYERILRGDPAPRAVLLPMGIVLLALGLGFPLAFVMVFFATTTAPILVTTFIGTLLAPLLVRAGWGSVRAQRPLVE